VNGVELLLDKALTLLAEESEIIETGVRCWRR
jgi:hypothetical protein